MSGLKKNSGPARTKAVTERALSAEAWQWAW
jgi:hypothetical protein